MTKRKRRSRRRANRPVNFLRNAMNYFKHGNYDRAIQMWEQAKAKDAKLLPTAALAEAYFRRGIEALQKDPLDLEKSFQDIQHAAELEPDSAVYQYHLGLAAHRLGNMEAAQIAYQKAGQLDETLMQRAAYPLALTYLQTGEDPASKPLWSHLPAPEQTLVQAADAFRRRPYTVPKSAPRMWQALAALDQGEREIAQTLLNEIVNAPASDEDVGAAHYYLGVLAAQADDELEARRQWGKAALKGYHTPELTANLGELYHRLAEEKLSEDALEAALDAAQEALRHTPDDKRLQTLMSQIYQRQAYQFAAEGNWEHALDHWQRAYEIEGGSFRLAYNLALAHEKIEDFWIAGEFWREVLRRRPRLEDRPDYINDEEVAKLWRRTAEAYTQAGEYEEAVNVYKLAVKWNPEHLETRMDLVQGLIDNGQLQAAQNELERILARDTDYVPALLQMGEVLTQSEYWWSASGALKYYGRVLELEPDNLAARQGLVDFYMDRGDYFMQWGDFGEALKYYEQALDVHPQNGEVLAVIGGCYMSLEELETAESYLASALEHAQGNVKVYTELVNIWLAQGNDVKAWEIVAQAEAVSPDLPLPFYLLPGLYCLDLEREASARSWFDHIIAKFPLEKKPLLVIGEFLTMTPALDLAKEYLERARAENHNPGLPQAMLSIVALREDNFEQAQQYIEEAANIAKRTRDPELLAQVRSVRGLLALPPETLNFILANPTLFGPVGPFSGAPFPDFMGDEYYDDEYYDDEEFSDDFFDIY